MSSEQDRQIEELLERCGRDAQPRQRSWDGLPARLAGIPQVGARRHRRWLVVAGVAAMMTLAVGLAIYLASGGAVMAAPGPIQVMQKDIEVTAFNETETEGQALFMPLAQASSQGEAGQLPNWSGQAQQRMGMQWSQEGWRGLFTSALVP